MGKIKSCRKYENPIEFEATHKIFMDCNVLPQVRGADKAIWRRLRPVPFEVSIEETDEGFDKNLAQHLELEAEGILAWAIRGCIAWLKDGLGDVPEVRVVKEEWREHDDPLVPFIEDCVEDDEESWVESALITRTYQDWAKQNGERPLGRNHFLDRMKKKGYFKSKEWNGKKQVRALRGLKLRDGLIMQ